ncbi:MAG: FAD-binding oxidoreductase, partial [Pseudomonadota bacterium]
RVRAVHTRQGTIRAGAVLCAAGLGTAALSRSIGISLPIHAIRLPVAETEKTTPFTRLAVWAPDVALRPTGRNTFYIGSGFRSTSGDLDVTLDALRHLKLFLPRLMENQRLVNIRVGSALLRSLKGGIRSDPEAEPVVNDRIIDYNMRGFRGRFPHLGDLGVMRCWAGQTDVTPDMIPVIGATAGVANFYVAAGYSGHGFALGPVSGKLISELMLTGKSSIDLSAFRPSRFAEGDLQIVPRHL